jgi:choline-phosphate cytidylyltransferase
MLTGSVTYLMQTTANVSFKDEVIENAPLIITEEFMQVHSIDYVLHSFSDQSDADKQSDFYKVPRERDAFIQVPYSTGTSTSDIIKKIKSIG